MVRSLTYTLKLNFPCKNLKQHNDANLDIVLMGIVFNYLPAKWGWISFQEWMEKWSMLTPQVLLNSTKWYVACNYCRACGCIYYEPFLHKDLIFSNMYLLMEWEGYTGKYLAQGDKKVKQETRNLLKHVTFLLISFFPLCFCNKSVWVQGQMAFFWIGSCQLVQPHVSVFSMVFWMGHMLIFLSAL